MRVVRETILDKINAELAKNSKDIIRIELTTEEFRQFIKDLRDPRCKHSDIRKVVINGFEWLDVNHRKIPHNTMSGSYVVYRGVCIQTHEEYTA